MTSESNLGSDELTFELAEGFHQPVRRPTPTSQQWRAMSPVDGSEPATDVVEVTDSMIATLARAEPQPVFVTPPPIRAAANPEPSPRASVRPTPPTLEPSGPSTALVRAAPMPGREPTHPTPPKLERPRASPPKGLVRSPSPMPESHPQPMVRPNEPAALPLAGDDALALVETDPVVQSAAAPRELPMAMPAFVAERGPTTNEAMQALRPRRWLRLAGGALAAVALFGTLLWREVRSSTPGAPEPLAQASFPAPPLVQVPDDDFAAFPVRVLPRVEEPRPVLPERLHEEARPVREDPDAPGRPPELTRAVRPPAPSPARPAVRAHPLVAPSRTKPSPVAEPDLLDAWQ